SVLFYELDEEAAKAYEALTHAFDDMISCSGKWHMQAPIPLRRPRQPNRTRVAARLATVALPRRSDRWCQSGRRPRYGRGRIGRRRGGVVGSPQDERRGSGRSTIVRIVRSVDRDGAWSWRWPHAAAH